MRALLIPETLAAIIAGTPLAVAAAQQTTGTVKSYDAKSMMLTLKDGASYQFSKGFKNPGVKAGGEVTVTWDMKNGKHMATKLQIAN